MSRKRQTKVVLYAMTEDSFFRKVRQSATALKVRHSRLAARYPTYFQFFKSHTTNANLSMWTL